MQALLFPDVLVQAIILPLIYARPAISTPTSLFLITNTLLEADSRWDHLRRIPYSTPGRWIVTLDLSRLSCSYPSKLAVDTALTQLFPLVPLLEELILNPIGSGLLSRRALRSLRDVNSMRGNTRGRLRVLKGLAVVDRSDGEGERDILKFLAAMCELEELDITGTGFGESDVDGELPEMLSPVTSVSLLPGSSILSLPRLHTLGLLALPLSPIPTALCSIPLPSLRSLTLTSYHGTPLDDQALAAQALGIPTPDGGPGFIGGFAGPQATSNRLANLTATFLEAHGGELTQLTLLASSDWPPVAFMPPATLLVMCPKLVNLSLLGGKMEQASHTITSLRLTPPSARHPLRSVSLNRPDDALLKSLEACLRAKADSPISQTPYRSSSRLVRSSSSSPIANTRSSSLLPHLTTVQFLSVRWLKSLYSSGALNTGTSGGMRRWRASLRLFGVKVFDMDGNCEA